MKNTPLLIRKTLVATFALGCSFISYSQNTVYGQYALISNTSGVRNSAFGYSALYHNTTGINNSAFGQDALNNNTSGGDNTAVGYKSLFYNTTGIVNTAVGQRSMEMNTSGSYNTALGTYALQLNTTGMRNTACGYVALEANTTGMENAAFGHYSLGSNTTGSGNTAMGNRSNYSNTTGIVNVSVGQRSMEMNTTGSYNTAIGSYSLQLNISGLNNTACGYAALEANQSGSNNTASGYLALGNNMTGSNNTSIGVHSLFDNYSGYNNTAGGIGTLEHNTNGNYNTAFGDHALYSNSTGSDNSAFGSYAGYYSPTYLSNSLALGNLAAAMASNTAVIGNSNVISIGGQVGWSTLSDGRFKENVESNVPGMEFIEKLRPVTYNYDLGAFNKHSGLDIENDTILTDEAKKAWMEQQTKSESITYTGFIAQEVEEAAKSIEYNFSGVVKPQSEQDHYAIRYAEFVVPLVKATQEQQGELDALKNEIAELRQILTDMVSGSANSNREAQKEILTVKCYPNPTQGKVNLAIDNANQEAVNIMVYSSTGELIYSGTTERNASQLELDFSNQPNGSYIIQTTIGGVFFQNRITVQK